MLEEAMQPMMTEQFPGFKPGTIDLSGEKDSLCSVF
jgi:hypothetical protein